MYLFIYLYIMLRYYLILLFKYAIYLLVPLICNIIIHVYIYIHNYIYIICVEVEVVSKAIQLPIVTPPRNPRLRLPLQPGQVMARCGPFEDGVPENGFCVMGKPLENDAKKFGLGVQTHGCQRCRQPAVCPESFGPGLVFFMVIHVQDWWLKGGAYPWYFQFIRGCIINPR